jgi:hypothetical protein
MPILAKVAKIFPEDDITLDVVIDCFKRAKKVPKLANSITDKAPVKDPKDKSNLK